MEQDWEMMHGISRHPMERDGFISVRCKEHFTVSQFKKAMQGIYSTCIDEGTLDEAPFAYRCMDDILEVIGETVCVDQIIRPIYNFKAGRKKKRNTLKDEK